MDANPAVCRNGDDTVGLQRNAAMHGRNEFDGAFAKQTMPDLRPVVGPLVVHAQDVMTIGNGQNVGIQLGQMPLQIRPVSGDRISSSSRHKIHSCRHSDTANARVSSTVGDHGTTSTRSA